MTSMFPPMPKTRGECENGPRPCPWIKCRHHLFHNESSSCGGLNFREGHIPFEDMDETCSLDVAENGGMKLEDIASLMGITRERVRQIEAIALKKLARRHLHVLNNIP